MLIDVEFNSGAVYPARGVVEASRLAEAKGFGAVWEGEANNKDPVVLMSAVAACTERIAVGTAVLHLFARTPVTTGILAATLDELSEGRFILGLGASNPTIASWHGAEFDAPLRRMEEYIDIVRRVVRREKLQYEGKKYRSFGFRSAFRGPRENIPIYLAALGDQMTALAGRLADGLLINMAPADHLRRQAQAFREAARQAGRDPSAPHVVVKVRCAVSQDLEAARDAVRTACTFYGLADFYRDMLTKAGLGPDVERMREAYRSGGFAAAKAQVSEAMLQVLPVVAATSLDEVKRRLVDYERAGATRIIVAFLPTTNDPMSEVTRLLEAW